MKKLFLLGLTLAVFAGISSQNIDIRGSGSLY